MIRINSQLISLFVGVLLLLSSCNSGRFELRHSDVSYHLIDSLVGYNEAMDAVIKPYRDSLNQEMQKVIGHSQQELSGGLPEGLLSNFVTDLMLVETGLLNPSIKVDISIVNIKGLRVPVNKGPITVESIYQLMPFENEVVYLTLTHQQVKELFDFMASVGGDGMSGASFAIKNKKAVDIKVGGQALEERNYIIATSDYLADGGDHFNVFLSAIKREEAGIKVRDAILQHIERLTAKNKLVNSQLDKRIYYAE
ncbi:5'-nucleotidase C-terminal domain-containing protein [Carboxylicivirga mesophila]|uniref:5'-nucleotidase C-terminal domain-containing protein n=1 Tax=Carboxylicivirga mesophila TaxID=1166478 RepID=A0ABS5KEG2_9BACT|nr:5'-nucleotidase [Carboxylicivirga mesophila]MBS2213371.1 5'-nucleotidase C-terminal domain-containing protein [Carboxylicivirga mesophila]